MKMTWKSILKPENSVMAGVGTIGAVFAIYQMNVGSVAESHATDSNHPALAVSKKKAGYAALALVAGLVVITKDANIGILGGATIIAMELSYRHAIMANPQSGQMENPNPATAYEPAQNVIPFYAQGETG
jgi:hypothetical protein